MAQAQVNSGMLVWARERAGLDVPVLAQKLLVREERLRDWESGEERPTFRQARLLAHHTHGPFGYIKRKLVVIHEETKAVDGKT